MRRISTALISRAAMALAGVLTVCLLAGCGKAPATPAEGADKTPAKKTSTGPTVPPPAAIAAAPTNTILSVFSTDNPRDPFHPNVKLRSAVAPVVTGVPSDSEQPLLITAIQAGFQGIYGGTEDRVVMVHGVLVPENRDTVVVVPVNGQQRRLKVKAVQIHRSSAVLQVEGLSGPVTVPRAR